MKEDPPLDFKCKDKFLVQAIKIQNTDSDDLQELWTRAENLKKVDPEGAKELICEKKLRCVFLPPGGNGALPTSPPAETRTITATELVDASKQVRQNAAPVAKEGVPQDLDRELRDAREAVKRLTAACEGYKSEIERLNLLRQRRGAGGNSGETWNAESKGTSSALASQGGLHINIVIFIALIAFILGAYLL
ncbi:hypothetical protein HDU96_000614 [Phlyctochytrium bullatum]|nr:hypothetical protein HDU96_000614 [Phlyctochytrium bullatum]